MFSLLHFSLSFLNLGLNNLDVALGSVIKEVINVTHKVTVSVWIYYAIKSMNWTFCHSTRKLGTKIQMVIVTSTLVCKNSGDGKI